MLEILVVQHLLKVAYAPNAAMPRTPQVYAAYASVLPEVKCFFEEARKQSLPPELLLAIMRTENGKRGQFVKNHNGSYDIGPMQINTGNLPELARVTGQPVAVVERALSGDVCFNIATGAWILRRDLNASKSLWAGVGLYNAPFNSPMGATYASKVRGQLLVIAKQLAEAPPQVVPAPLADAPWQSPAGSAPSESTQQIVYAADTDQQPRSTSRGPISGFVAADRPYSGMQTWAVPRD